MPRAFAKENARLSFDAADAQRAIETLGARRPAAFLEVGPGSTLSALGRTAIAAEGAEWLTSIRKDGDDWRQVIESVACLYTCGVDPDWSAFDAPYARRKVALPTYPFQRQPFWVEKLGRSRRSARNRVSLEQAYQGV